MSERWPAAVVIAICAAFGATAIGWNGVQLAQVARHAPPGQAATVTGASGFVTFAGVVLGPPTFALLATLIGSYRIGFAAFGSPVLGCGLWLLVKAQAVSARCSTQALEFRRTVTTKMEMISVWW